MKKIVTHNGDFHADDVFAVATLELFLKGKTEVIRTRDEEIIKSADFVVDVGGKYDPEKNLFDHHQIGGPGVRGNGITYSSFGLVWKKFGGEICGSEIVALRIDKNLVAPIDALDNGEGEFTPIKSDIFQYDISDTIASLNPTWKEKLDRNKMFAKAVSLAKIILKREIKTAKDNLKGEKNVEKAYKKAPDKRIIILEESLPYGIYEEVLKNYSEPLFVVAPNSDGVWRVKAIRGNSHTFKLKKSLPESWAGKTNEDLVKATGVSDAIFCHTKLFIATAKSREGAIQLAKLAVDSLGKN